MSVQAGASAVHGIEQLLFFTLMQIVIILAAARVAGHLARRLGQPRVVGEIVAGLLLGPSLFGMLAPGSFDFVFHSADGAPVSVMSQIGLIMLMFQIGLEFEFGHLRERRNRLAVSLVAGAGIILPFVLGLWFGHVSAPYLAPGINVTAYALFMGTALSITAVPVLGRIMMEFDLTRTRLGTVTIAAAAVNDVVGWILLALVSAITVAHFSPAALGWQIFWLAAYVLGSWLVVRTLLKRMIGRFREGLSQDLMAILLGIIFVSAMLTSQIGIFAIFGGFMMGVLLHDEPALVAAWKEKVADLVTVLFLPIFFTYTGLRTNILGLDSPELWLWCVLAILLASVGKFVGAYIGTRLAGLSSHEARNIAIMMNTRGLMELVVINIGYDLGVIPQEVFTMLVLMAVFSTVITAPMLRRWLPPMGHVIPVGREA